MEGSIYWCIDDDYNCPEAHAHHKIQMSEKMMINNEWTRYIFILMIEQYWNQIKKDSI